MQRYIYVCHAAVAKQWCTLARSRLFVFLVLGFAVTYMLPRVLDRNYAVIQGGLKLWSYHRPPYGEDMVLIGKLAPDS